MAKNSRFVERIYLLTDPQNLEIRTLRTDRGESLYVEALAERLTISDVNAVNTATPKNQLGSAVRFLHHQYLPKLVEGRFLEDDKVATTTIS